MLADQTLDRRSTDERMDGHEAVCLVRYDSLMEKIGGLTKRMGRIEGIIIGAASAVIFALIAVVWWAFQLFVTYVLPHLPAAV